jgi:hypothetical protein
MKEAGGEATGPFNVTAFVMMGGRLLDHQQFWKHKLVTSSIRAAVVEPWNSEDSVSCSGVLSTSPDAVEVVVKHIADDSHMHPILQLEVEIPVLR